MSHLQELENNLDRFIRRYYLNQLLKGAFWATGTLLTGFLLVAFLEYFGHFNSGMRAFLFYGFLTLSTGILLYWIFAPLAKMAGIVKRMDRASAALEIARLLDQVEDKAFNTLQLAKEARASSNLLAMAGVEQKAAMLKNIPFENSIRFKATARILAYATIPLVVMIGIGLIAPSIIKESTSRLVNYDAEFVPPAPFEFVLITKDLNVPVNSDFTVEMEIKGNTIPEFVFLETKEGRFKMKPEGKTSFSYQLRNVRSNLPFRFQAQGFASRQFEIKTIPVPALMQVELAIDYPSYTGFKDEIRQGLGDLSVPEGTSIEWRIDGKNADGLEIIEADIVQTIDRDKEKGIFLFGKRLLQPWKYGLFLSNENGYQSDTVSYHVNVEKDQYPFIEASEETDSLNQRVKYFAGRIRDDYGFSNLAFVTERAGKNGSVERQETSLDFSGGETESGFTFFWNADTVSLKAGETIHYYFQVWDNDGVNGAKSTKSAMMQLHAPTEGQLENYEKKSTEKVAADLKDSMKELSKLKQELKDLKNKLLQKKELTWQDKEQMKEILEKQKEIEKQIREAQKENTRKNMEQSRYREYSPELLEKQRQLEEMFEKLMDDEMKQLFDEMNELMEELNREQMMEKLDQMEFTEEQLEKELDRSLELFKQLEFEKQLEESINALNELQKDQEALKEETGQKEKSNDELANEQNKLNEDFEQVKEQLDELEKMNQELEKPTDLPNMEEKEQEATQQMDQAKENLEENKMKKASENQQKAGDKIQEMSQALQQAQQEMQMEMQAENLDALRQILENLVQLSKDQERIMEDLKSTSQSDPKYIQLAQGQKKIKDDAKVVEDSLLALSKRVMQISNIVNEEIGSVNMNMDKALDFMTNQLPNQEHIFKARAAERQQYVMTSMNNLALLLDEIMQQMQQQAMSQMKGDGSCNKPGQGKSGKPSMSDMKKMQDAINKQIEQLKKQLEQEGKNPGKNKGNSPMPGGNGKSMSKELARLAAEQSALRNELRKLASELEKEGEKGSGSSRMNELQKMMEETEKDLVNKKITMETLKRQEEIMTRLLESERAERERELDKKRESKSGKDAYEVPDHVMEEYLKRKAKETELYQTTPPQLEPFYRKKVNSYFSGFETK